MEEVSQEDCVRMGVATVAGEGILEMSIFKLVFEAWLGLFPAPWFGHLPLQVSASDL